MSNFNTTDTNVIELVRECLKLATKGLEHGKKYTAKKIFPAEVWGVASKYSHNEFGRILAQLVKLGQLPLIRVESTTSNHSQYILKH